MAADVVCEGCPLGDRAVRASSSEWMQEVVNPQRMDRRRGHRLARHEGGEAAHVQSKTYTRPRVVTSSAANRGSAIVMWRCRQTSSPSAIGRGPGDPHATASAAAARRPRRRSPAQQHPHADRAHRKGDPRPRVGPGRRLEVEQLLGPDQRRLIGHPGDRDDRVLGSRSWP